jgi:tetratricopeptide (TPR) repeat protein
MRALAYAHGKVEAELALEDIARIREVDPTSVSTFEPEILALLALDRIDEASAALDALGARIEQEGDENLRAWYCATMAIFADDSGEEELAESRWTECVNGHPTDPGVVKGAVEYFEKRGNLQRSVEILEEANAGVELSNRVFRASLAPRLRAMGRYEEGEALLLEGARSSGPAAAAGYWLELSMYYEQSGHLEEAADAAERALETIRELAEPLASQIFGTADVSLRAGRLERALELADELDVPAFALLIRARVAQKRRDFEKALDLYDEVARVWPDNAYARYHAARTAEALGQFDRAIELYRHATRIEVDAAGAQTQIARIQLAEGRPVAALETLQAQSSRAPLELDGHLLYLQLQGRLTDPRGLPTAISQFEQRWPGEAARALEHAALGLADRQQHEEALALIESAQESFLLAARSAPALRAYVLSASKAGRLQGADALVSRALAANPKSADHLEVRALAEELGGADPQSTRERYLDVLRVDPDHAHALAALGRLEIPRDATAALALLDRALRVEEPDLDAVRAATAQLEHAGRRDEALHLYERLLEATPYDGVAANALCRAGLDREGPSDRVLDLGRRAARFDRTAATVLQLARIYALRGEMGRAEELEKAAAELSPRGATNLRD